MMNVGRGCVSPSLRLGSEFKDALYSDRSAQAREQSRYIARGAGYGGVGLYDRQFYPALTPQLYMTTHSPRVSSLLWQRTLLNNRYQKNIALSNYLNALSALWSDLPKLDAYKKGHLMSFTPVGYDIASYPAGINQPVSVFSQPNGRQLCGQYIRKYSAATLKPPLIMPYLAEAKAYHHYLSRLLYEQQQQLTFYGMPYQVETFQAPAAYRFQDVIKHSGWLQEPENKPVPLLATRNNVRRDSEAELFLIPVNESSKDMDTSISESKPSDGSFGRYGPAFSQCFHRFPPPISTEDKQAADEVGADMNAPAAVRGRRASPMFTQSAKSVYTPTPTAHHRATRRHYRLPRDITTLAEGIKCLEGQFWSNYDDKQPDSRERLNQLFDKGQRLFENYPYSIGKTSALRFIELFSQALRREVKNPNQRETAEQKRKKAERIKALDAIQDFVKTLSNQDKSKLRLAIQLCGRVRERSLVEQFGLNYCGGFAILQALWGREPLRAVQITLSLAQYGVARVASPYGRIYKLRVPYGYSLWQLTRHQEALADTLPLCTFYNCTRFQPASVKHDAAYAIRLGLEPMLYHAKPFSQFFSSSRKKQEGQFLSALCQASRAGVPIRGGVGPVFEDYLCENIDFRKRVRKPNILLRMFTRLSRFWSGKGQGHAVIFEDFRVAGDKVMFKVYTWGRSYRCSMTRKLFFQLIDKRRFLITDWASIQSSSLSKRVGRFIDAHALIRNKVL